MKKTTKLLLLDSSLHGITDFLSITTLLAMLLISQNDMILTLVIYALYVFVAFITQPVVGYFFDLDALDKESPCFAKIAGSTTILLSVMVIPIALCLNAIVSNDSYPAVQTFPGGQYSIVGITMITALCNCIFHVFGGRRTYQHANGKALPFGVFIAPGGIGYAAAVLVSTISMQASTMPIIIVAIIACILGIIVIKTDIGNRGDASAIHAEPINLRKKDLPLIALLIAGVVGNGVAGYAIASILSEDADIMRVTQETGFLIPIATLILIAVLKIIGGLLHDKLGLKATLIISTFCGVIGIGALCALNNLPVFMRPFNISATLLIILLYITSISIYVLIAVRSYFTWALFNNTPGFAFGIGGFAIGASAIVYTLIHHNATTTPFAIEQLRIALACTTIGQSLLIIALIAVAVRFKLFEPKQKRLDTTRS